MTGSKTNMWKQDPSVKKVGIRTTYIPTEVSNGPSDADISIEGVPTVIGNADNDFMFDPAENPIEFDAVHTFTVVRKVLTMYRRAFNRNNITQNFSWQWGQGPIRVYPRAGIEANAYYSREEKGLRFFYFHPGNNEAEPLLYTCRSFDIAAHETGHAILDSLKPGFWNSWHPQTGGLHEAFGDLTSILAMLSQMDMCEAIIAESKGDLHAKSFFPAVAEQFGEAFGRTDGLRNADNDLKLSEVSNEVHDLSKVFTGAVYDILADCYKDYYKEELYDQSETLFRIGKHVTSLLIMSIYNGPERNATYKDIANQMIEIEPDAKRKEFIQKQFADREIIGGPKGMASESPQKLSWSRCCGSMRHMEHVREVDKAIRDAG